MIRFAWGAADPGYLTVLKRIFILLPSLSFILACWVSMGCLVSVIVRPMRTQMIAAILITWWDWARSILMYWGGFIKFLFCLAVAVIGLFKFAVVGLWSLIQDFVLLPFRIIRDIGENVLNPGVPWIAVLLTLVWCLLEAAIFTYVTSPLVIDTFSNMTGNQLSDSTIRIPLFLFMFFIVLGSYSVLTSLAESLKARNIPGIVKIAVIEFVAMFVEIVFLYREFVDSLVPWFAQHSENFELGIVGTLVVAGVTWLGVRGLSWFLFAAHGTPMIMAVIRGSGVRAHSSGGASRADHQLAITAHLIDQIIKELGAVVKLGEELLGSFLIPPLQVFAAAINFCTLLVTGQHLFELPFKSIEQVMNSGGTLHHISRRGLKVVGE